MDGIPFCFFLMMVLLNYRAGSIDCSGLWCGTTGPELSIVGGLNGRVGGG